MHIREDLADTIKRAFYLAKSGRTGVVVVDFPKDIQKEYGSDFYPPKYNTEDNKNISIGSGGFSGKIEKALNILNKAERPVFLIGGGVNIARGGKEMTRLAEFTKIPVVTTIMGKGEIPTTCGLYVGNLGIHGSYGANMAVSRCDVLFAIGTRFNDRITGNIQEFALHPIIIHADIDGDVISRNVTADVSIVADAKEVISALLKKAVPLNTEKRPEP